MEKNLTGLHHVTAIAGDAQQNVDFYSGVLGLRLVKQTVNFDDPNSYHLYYGDGFGTPGTLLTFFAWPGARRGRPGLGQVTEVGLSVSPEALEFWRLRLKRFEVPTEETETRFGETILPFQDPDGMRLVLVAAPTDLRSGWIDGPISAENAIRGLHSVTLPERSAQRTAQLLTQTLGFELIQADGDWTRYGLKDGEPGTYADIQSTSEITSGQIAVGSIHHVAWRTPDDTQQEGWLREISDLGYGISPVMDREYFHSIYFREPGGVLFEIATDPPGFTVDEPLQSLGEKLQLPPQYEPMRAQVESNLTPLHIPRRL